MPGTFRPLDGLPSIKWKLGTVIVAAVLVTVVVVDFGVRAGVSPVLSGLAAGSLSLLMVQLLARGMTSPLREMASASRAMARGDYGRRVTASSRDEVGELARAFNQMATELAEVDRMRRDLVANVSHELRTPITALQAGLENLVDGVEPPDPDRLRTMLKQAERLGRLVTQLLDPHVQVSVSVEEPGLVADGDPERVHQVVANLLENAIRHSPTGGKVEVVARPDKGRVAIEVLDEGPGIPEEEASRVFERFYRADTARSSSVGGSGLGLAIARWIVDLHGGDIRAERRAPTGCRMVVLLPGAAR